jgi:hypothetical protein
VDARSPAGIDGIRGFRSHASTPFRKLDRAPVAALKWRTTSPAAASVDAARDPGRTDQVDFFAGAFFRGATFFAAVLAGDFAAAGFAAVDFFTVCGRAVP